MDSAWVFDPAGRPESLRTGGHTLAFDHDIAGREISRRIGDAATLTQRWDADHRLTAQSIWNSAGQAQPGGPAQYRAYLYSQASDLLMIADRLTGDRRFDLDPAGRITAVHGQAWAERYRYDATGNLTGASIPAAGGDVAETLGYSGTLIRHAGHFSYTHDGQGRITARRVKSLSGKIRTWAYTWDANDRLTQVMTPDRHQWRYRYDPIGRRIAKEHYAEDGTTLLETTAFTWDGPVLVEQTSQRPGEPPRTTTWDYEPGSFTPLTQTERTGPARRPAGRGRPTVLRDHHRPDRHAVRAHRPQRGPSRPSAAHPVGHDHLGNRRSLDPAAVPRPVRRPRNRACTTTTTATTTPLPVPTSPPTPSA